MFRFSGYGLRKDVENLDTGERYPFMVIGNVYRNGERFYMYDVFDTREDADKRVDEISRYHMDGMSWKDKWRALKGSVCRFEKTFRIRGYRIGEYYELTEDGFARYISARSDDERVYLDKFNEVRSRMYDEVLTKFQNMKDLLDGTVTLQSHANEDQKLIYASSITLGVQKYYEEYLDGIGGLVGEEMFINECLRELDELREELGVYGKSSSVSSLETLYVDVRYRFNNVLMENGIDIAGANN